jgi:hypothetical protein
MSHVFCDVLNKNLAQHASKACQQQLRKFCSHTNEWTLDKSESVLHNNLPVVLSPLMPTLCSPQFILPSHKNLSNPYDTWHAVVFT